MIELAWLTIRARRRRILLLAAFAGLFLAAAVTARIFVADEEGHVDVDALFLLGGYPLVSALLLLGWLLGRFPTIATLVLVAGLFSDDRDRGHARLLAVRPTAPAALYGVRFVVLAGLAFTMSALLLPVFDLLMLGTWAGPATLVLVLAQVLFFGALVALLSVWVKGDAWIALFLFLAALVWDALIQAGSLQPPAGVHAVVAFLLPPQSQLLRLEEAFGALQPIPWDAFVDVAGYGLVLLALAGLSVAKREI